MRLCMWSICFIHLWDRRWCLYCIVYCSLMVFYHVLGRCLLLILLWIWLSLTWWCDALTALVCSFFCSLYPLPPVPTSHTPYIIYHKKISLLFGLCDLWHCWDINYFHGNILHASNSIYPWNVCIIHSRCACCRGCSYWGTGFFSEVFHFHLKGWPLLEWGGYLHCHCLVFWG